MKINYIHEFQFHSSAIKHTRSINTAVFMAWTSWRILQIMTHNFQNFLLKLGRQNFKIQTYYLLYYRISFPLSRSYIEISPFAYPTNNRVPFPLTARLLTEPPSSRQLESPRHHFKDCMASNIKMYPWEVPTAIREPIATAVAVPASILSCQV